jgi:hypothetical protein
MISRLLSKFLWSWTRSLRRPPRPIRELQAQLVRARVAHKPTRQYLKALQAERIAAMKRELGVL